MLQYKQCSSFSNGLNTSTLSLSTISTDQLDFGFIIHISSNPRSWSWITSNYCDDYLVTSTPWPRFSSSDTWRSSCSVWAGVGTYVHPCTPMCVNACAGARVPMYAFVVPSVLALFKSVNRFGHSHHPCRKPCPPVGFRILSHPSLLSPTFSRASLSPHTSHISPQPHT